jgi:signal transduction histidine kinase/HAMP domain-containing protein
VEPDSRPRMRARLTVAIEWLPRLVARVPATVHTKLLVGFLVIAVLLIALGAVGLQVLSRVNRQAEDLVRRHERIAAYRQFQHDTSLPPSWSWNERTLDATVRHLNQFGYQLDQLQFAATDDAELLARVRETYDQFITVVGQVIELIHAGNVAEGRKLQVTRASPLADDLERLTNDLVNKAEVDLVASIDASGVAYMTSQWVVIAFAVGSIGLALVLGYAISWSLIGPVELMATRLGRVAAGDFSQRLEVPNRDELGVLALQFNQMTAQLEASYAALEDKTRALGEAVEELQALGEVSRAVSSTLDLETVLDTIVARSVQLSSTAGGAIYEYDEASQEFHLRATHRMDDELVEVLRAAPIRLGEGATGRAAAIRAPVQITDIRDDREYGVSRVRAVFERHGYRAVLAVPLFLEQRVLGALAVWRREPGTFTPDVVNLLQQFATQSALALQNARLFRELADKSRELEVASRHKSEFLANMSHELRTPLNAIIGFSEVLVERMFGELNDKQEEYLRDIYASGTHLLSLINDILDLSKVEAGRMELELSAVRLPRVIDDALILVRERAMRRGITLRASIDDGLGEVRADERKIKQVVLNLLSNAIKFTPEGGRVEVRTVAVDGGAEVSVADTGVGIAPEDLDAVFEEFRQVGASTAKHEGTGLGLALCRRFIELHGGRIRVTSQVGVGSTFTFTLPGG